MTETKSTLALDTLQESLDASASAGKLLRTGSAQYFTPPWFAKAMGDLLPNGATVFDPQCGQGALLLNGSPIYAEKFGCELDPKCKADDNIDRLTGNCVAVWEILDELFPDLTFARQVANPPFSLSWKTKHGPRDSTLHTWLNLINRAGRSGCGYMIANRSTIEKLNLHQDEKAWLYQTFPPGIFPSAPGLEVGVLHFHGEHKGGISTISHASSEESEVLRVLAKLKPQPECHDLGSWGNTIGEINRAWETIRTILAEEKRDRSPFNIWLDERGRLRSYLSTRERLTRKLNSGDLFRLSKLNGSHPLALTPDKETRDLLAEFVNAGIYTFEPAARQAVLDALASVNTLAVPIMPVTDFQRVAYCDEEETLVALAKPTTAENVHWFEGKGKASWAKAGNYACQGITLTPGKSYPLTTASYNFVQRFQRTKLHTNEEEGSYTQQHEMTLTGADRYIEMKDDRNIIHRFLDRPDAGLLWQHGTSDGGASLYHHHDALLWHLFARPSVPTVADKFPAKLASNLAMMEACESLGGFQFYHGQRDYLARVATRDYAMVAAATGVGKTLLAISLIQLKSPRRALIVAPQGTTRAPLGETESAGALTASQWTAEIRRFAPGLPIFELFSREDYDRILSLNRGQLPPGVYVSYYEAMFTNGARETLTPSFNDQKACKEVGIPLPDLDSEYSTMEYVEGIGSEANGIRCVWRPCLATQIGHLFDFVGYDEAHRAQHGTSIVTQMMLRMQPRFRYAFSATPIPNIASDIFQIAGWLCVPGWYQGGMRNAAWPYAKEEGARFCKTFLATERDLTQEAINSAKTKTKSKTKFKVEKVSPIISSPARLLKLLTPFTAYISKEDCRADLPPRILHDVRVPMGKQQGRLYAHYMERRNIPGATPLERASKQINILRAMTADPAGSDWNNNAALRVTSTFNPKLAAILSLVQQMLGRGEQAVIVCSRLGQSNNLERRLHEAGVSTARIDSSLVPEMHTGEAHRFKAGTARVLLMGIKCAQAHSFPQCPNLIVGSLEYSCGTFEQAVGRVWRVNSPVPVHVWCVLHRGTIEEVMFDTVATKGDAAAICLRGQRVARDHKPVDLGEVLALNFEGLANINLKDLPDETTTEAGWPALLAALKNKSK